MNSLRQDADRILYEFGLLKKLEEIGPAHIVGSYRMDMMAWNDLDIDIENDGMSMERLYALTSFILDTFRPVWYEAKTEITADGKRVWFHGFETEVTGALWNIDLWFFDRETIAGAQAYCDDIAGRTSPEEKACIVRIKQDLIAKGLYSYEQYKSMDVYKAVTEDHVRDTQAFLSLFAQ